MISGQVDVVYGPKGSGKSALYSLLRQKRELLREEFIFMAAAENIRGTPVFEALVGDPPASEEQFRGLWKVYFLSLIGTLFRLAKFENQHAKLLLSALEEANLLPKDWSLKQSLRAALDYVRRVELSGEVKINPQTGQAEGVSGKVTLREPSADARKQGYISTDSLLEEADKALAHDGMKFWIVLDRLDVAFADSVGLEENALRALFRVYRDMAALNNISLKIFLRDDIWARITATGFREASHVTKSITITWDSRSILNLIIRRVLYNEPIRAFYRVNAADVLASAEEQEKLFYRIFPRQVDLGEKKPTTLDWMLTRTMDGTGKTTPRELIHLLSAARDQQLRLIEMGDPEPAGEALFDRTALKSGPSRGVQGTL